MIKHTVLIISYNQEKYIGAALESVVQQSILPYEIIVSDDCSTDNTWEIIQEYKNRYPAILNPYQHKQNVGLYKNLNFALRQITGDVLSAMGGDDFFEPGLFENLNKTININKINVEKDSFIIVTNTAHYYPNGKITYWNNYKLKNKNIFKEQLRGGVSLRWIGYSVKLLPFMFAEENIGYGADWLRNTILYYNCPKYYFADFVSTYYRVGVGVTSKLDTKKHALHSKSAIPLYIKNFGSTLEQNDFQYLKYAIALNNYQVNSSFINYLKAFGLLIYNINNFSINNNFLKQLKFFMPFKGLLYHVRKILYKY